MKSPEQDPLQQQHEENKRLRQLENSRKWKEKQENMRELNRNYSLKSYYKNRDEILERRKEQYQKKRLEKIEKGLIQDRPRGRPRQD